jgi:sugar phosphate isomerase/epimerase
MNVGYQTILFGPHIDDLDAVLQTIAGAGFKGVEIAQRPDMLRLRGRSEPVTVEQLVERLQAFDLTFMGLAGGTLKERIDFCLACGANVEEFRPLYLYADDYDQTDLKLAERFGFRIAVHPHVFMRCNRFSSADIQTINTHPNLCWLPDTAHLYIAGESVVDVLRAIPMDRIAAVHIKDWDAAYGRSYHRYARGFVPLGEGDVPIARVLEMLERRGYEGWLVAEQDYRRKSPEVCVHHAARYLISKRVMRGQTMPPLQDAHSTWDPDAPTHAVNEYLTAEARSEFAESLLKAGAQCLEECYDTVAQALYNLYGASNVSLWSCSAARNELCLLTDYPPLPALSDESYSILDRRDSLAGHVLDSRTITVFDLRTEPMPESGRTLKWRQIAEEQGATCLVALPVLNRFNHHHIRFLACVLLRDQPPPGMIESMSGIAEDMARAVDAALDDACAYGTGRVSSIADSTSRLKGFTARLRTLIQKELDCEGVTIFLANRTGERLEATDDKGLKWNADLLENEHYYLKDDMGSPTAQCWREGKSILVADAQQEKWGGRPHPPRSIEIGPGIDPIRHNILLVPLMSVTSDDKSGAQRISVVGVVRCRNKRAGEIYERCGRMHTRVFTDDDAAVLDSICQAALPHIVILRSDEQRREALGRVTHELDMPVNALRAAVDCIRADLTAAGKDYSAVFKYDYVSDVLTWTDLMVRVVGNAVIYGLKAGSLQLRSEPTFLMADVVAPAVRQVRYYLEERHFDERRITYSRFEEIPRIYVDRNQFQQVFFNLLSNAVKYAFKDPSQFRVEIRTAIEGDYYVITCCDWGPGIIEGYERAIFEEGVRGHSRANEMVSGLGLGLWVVREVVEAHGGYVAVTNHYRPTAISLYLPTTLRSSPPQKKAPNRKDTR